MNRAPAAWESIPYVADPGCAAAPTLAQDIAKRQARPVFQAFARCYTEGGYVRNPIEGAYGWSPAEALERVEPVTRAAFPNLPDARVRRIAAEATADAVPAHRRERALASLEAAQ